MTKKIRETKKVFIFIVEGRSDKHALEKIFQKIYRNKNVVFKVTGGDITSDEEMDESKVIEAIWLKVDEYIKDKKIVKKDIAQIIHFFDTDGVYVPDSAIIEGNRHQSEVARDVVGYEGAPLLFVFLFVKGKQSSINIHKGN